MTNTQPCPPGWRLIAQRSFSSGDLFYPRGSEVDPNDLAKWRNGASFLSNGTLEWRPPGPECPKPRPINAPPPAPVTKPPVVKVIEHPDPVEAVKRSKQFIRDQLPAGTAEDIIQCHLEGDPRGRELLTRAYRVDAVRNSPAAGRRPVRAL